jgi:hypothetical protein
VRSFLLTVCVLAQVAPIYKQMAEQYKDKAVFAKVDINANYQTASSQQIRRVLPIIARPWKCLAPQVRGGSRLQQHAVWHKKR